MDYLLRTTTKEDMNTVLNNAGLVSELTGLNEESFFIPIEGVSIDHIGSIAQPDIIEVVNGELTLITPGSVDNRWHTNIRVNIELTEEQIAALPTFEPLPTIPYRVFA